MSRPANDQTDFAACTAGVPSSTQLRGSSCLSETVFVPESPAKRPRLAVPHPAFVDTPQDLAGSSDEQIQAAILASVVDLSRRQNDAITEQRRELEQQLEGKLLVTSLQGPSKDLPGTWGPPTDPLETT